MKTLLPLLLLLVTARVTAQTGVVGKLTGTQQGRTLSYSFSKKDFPDSTRFTWGVKRASDLDTAPYLLGGTAALAGAVVWVYAGATLNTLPPGDYYLIVEATLPDKQAYEFRFSLPITRNQLPNPN